MFRQLLKSIKKHIKYNFLFYFILSIIFILGTILGPLVVKKFSSTVQKTVLKLSHPYFKNVYLGEYDGLSILKTSFFNNVLIVILIGVLGLINVGIIFIPMIVFIKSIFIGFSVSILVYKFGIRGFLASLLGIYPQNLFIIIGLIGAGAIAMTMSSSLTNLFRNKSTRNPNFNIQEYIILISTFTTITLVGGLIEGILSPIIMRLIINQFI